MGVEFLLYKPLNLGDICYFSIPSLSDWYMPSCYSQLHFFLSEHFFFLDRKDTNSQTPHFPPIPTNNTTSQF